MATEQISVVLYDNDEGCYRPCTAGSFNAPASNGTIECLACSPGYYCAGGCTEPVPCPAGTALTKYGGTSSSNCSACPSGHYAVVEASTSCIPCSAGHYCNSSFAGQVACDPGFYSGAGAESCSPCPDGSYNPFSAQASCQVCPAGYACSDKGAEATQCSPGSYSLGNATKCEECPAGYFCSGTGNSPEPCSNGAYSLSNWAYCVVCPAGHYCINSNEVGWWRFVLRVKRRHPTIRCIRCRMDSSPLNVVFPLFRVFAKPFGTLIAFDVNHVIQIW